MRIRKIEVAGCLLLTAGMMGTFCYTAIAQQGARARKEGETSLRLQAEASQLSIGTVSPNAATGVGSLTEGGESSQVIIFGGATDVPEDEHLETWVSRALAIYAQTDENDSRAKQRQEIAKALDTIFDLRQQQRVKELHELEVRVQKLKSTLDQRAASKAAILKNRLDYLTKEADGLGWGDGIPAPKRFGTTGIRLAIPTEPRQPASEAPDTAELPKTDPNPEPTFTPF